MITMMSALLSLSGCGADLNITTSQPAASPVAEAGTGAAETAGQTANGAAEANAAGQAAANTAGTANAAADIQGITGVWNEADTLDSRTLTVNADGTYVLAYKGGGSQFGTVKAETTENPDGSPCVWYNFYENVGILWEGFQKSGDTQNDLYSGQDGAVHFVRAAASDSNAAGNTASEPAPDVNLLNGEWYYEEQDPQNGAVYNVEGYVTVEAGGTYCYQPKNGSDSRRGTIKVDYDEFGDGSRVPFFTFYENNGTFWIGTYCQQNASDTYYIGNGGTARLMRRTTMESPFDDYVGQWQCDRCTITIADQGAGYGVEIHWADSASEDNVWTYSCVGSEDGTGIECYGGGTLVHTVTAEDGTETQTVVYNDGTAVFKMKGGMIFWQDVKEQRGDQMGFQKIS